MYQVNPILDTKFNLDYKRPLFYNFVKKQQKQQGGNFQQILEQMQREKVQR